MNDLRQSLRVVRADHDGPTSDETGAARVVAVRENGAVWLVIRDASDETPTYMVGVRGDTEPA